jgi:hypothetical protein
MDATCSSGSQKGNRKKMAVHEANEISLRRGTVGILLNYFENSKNNVSVLVRQLIQLQDVILVSFYLFKKI